MAEETKAKKKKLPAYIDSEGKRRDPNRRGDPVLCNGKSRRTKELCGNIARANGKCRVHGGNATGAKTVEGRKAISEAAKARNFKTGEYAPIWFDKLRPDEQSMLDSIPNDAEPLLEQEIKLTTVRERRMLGHLMDLEDKLYAGEADTTVQEQWQRVLLKDEYDEHIVSIRDDGVMDKMSELQLKGKVVIKEDVRKQIQSVEEALTRVQVHKSKLIELRHKLSEGTIDDNDGSLDSLVAIIGKARNLRVTMENQSDGVPVS